MTTHRRQPAVSPPGLLLRPFTWAAAAAFLLVPFFVTIPVALRKHPLIGPLGDLLHIPLLAGLTLLLYWMGPLRGRLWIAAAAAAVVGAAIEPLQLLVGRAGLWDDFLLDLVGIGMAVGFVLWRGHGRRLGLAALIALAAVVPYDLRELPAETRARTHCAALFPVIDDFEGTHMGRMWGNTDDAALGFPPIPDGPRGPSTVLSIGGGPPQTWPGARMLHFPYDWSDWRNLELTVRHTGPADRTVEFVVRLEDFAGRRKDGHVTTALQATAAWQTFSVPLTGRIADNVDHVMDLSDIEIMLIFLPEPADPVVIQVDDIRLRK